MAPLRRVKLQELNAHLVCVLCSGYFVEATTIIECLHTYCKTCIVRYLSTSSFCPICDVQVHKTRPLLSLREDRTLQDVVYKLVPGLHHSETKRRHVFYNEHPEGGGDKTEQGLRERRHFFHVDDQISLSLEYLLPSTTTNTAKPLSLSNGQVSVSNKTQDGTTSISEEVQKQDPKEKMDVDKDEKQSEDASKTPVHKRYLKCPAAVQVSHLEKFVRLKYGLSTHHKIDVMHGGDCLLSDLTLLDVVYMYKWQEDEPLRLFYTISAPVMRKRLRNNGMRTRTNVDSEQPVTKVAKLQNSEGEVTAETLDQHQKNNKGDDQSTLNEEMDGDDSMSADEDPLEQEKRLENADLCTIDTSDIFGSMNTFTFNLPSVPPLKTKNVQQRNTDTNTDTGCTTSPITSTTNITAIKTIAPIASVSATASKTSVPVASVSTAASKTSAPVLSVTTAVSKSSVPIASVSTAVSKSSAPIASVTTEVSKTSAPITSISTPKLQVAPVPKLSNKPVSNKSSKPVSTANSPVPVSSVETTTTFCATSKSPPLSKLSITKTSDGTMTSKFTSGDQPKLINTSASTAGKENTSTTNTTTVLTSSSSKPKAPNRVLPKLTATLPTNSNSNFVTNESTITSPNISSSTVKSTSPKTVTFSLASDPAPKMSVVTSVSHTNMTPKFVSLAQSNPKTSTTNSVVNTTSTPRPTNSTQLVNGIPEKPLSPIIPTKPRLGRPPNASRIAAAALGAARFSAPRGVEMKPPRAPAPQSANKVSNNTTVASLNVQSRLSSISGGPPRTGNAKLTVKRTHDARIQPPTPNMVSCPSPRPEFDSSMTSILSSVTSTPNKTTVAGSNMAITQTSRSNSVSASDFNMISKSNRSSPSDNILNSMPSKTGLSISSSTSYPIMSSCPSPRPHSITNTSLDTGPLATSQKSTVSGLASKSLRPVRPSQPNMASCPSPRPNMASCPSPRPNMASCPSPRPNMASTPSPRPNMASTPSPRPNMASTPSPRPNMVSCPSPRPNMASCPSPRSNLDPNSPRTSTNSSFSQRTNMVSCPSPRPNMVSCPSPRPNMASCPSPRPNMVSCPSPRPSMASCPSPNPYSFDMSSGRPQVPPSPRPHTLATPSPRQTTSRANMAVSKNSPQPPSPLAAGANNTARSTPPNTSALQRVTQPMMATTNTPSLKPNKTPKSPRRGGNSPTIMSIAQQLTNRAVQQQTSTSAKNGSLPITTLAKNTNVASTNPGLRSPPTRGITTNALGYPTGINPALASLAAGGAMGGMNPALVAAYLASQGQGLASQSLAYSDPSMQDVATMRNLITLSQTAALLRDTNLAALVQQAQQNQVSAVSPPQPEPAPIDLSPTSKAAPVTQLTNGRSKDNSTTTNAPSQKSKNPTDKSAKSLKSSSAKSTLKISAPTAEVTITKLPNSSTSVSLSSSSTTTTTTTATTGSKSVPPLVKMSKTNSNTVSITKRPVSSNKITITKSPANASLRQIPNPSLLRQQSEVRNNNNNNKNTTFVQNSNTSIVNGKSTGQIRNTVKVTGNSPLKETGPLPETSSILKIEHLTRSLPTAATVGQNQYRYFENR